MEQKETLRKENNGWQQTLKSMLFYTLIIGVLTHGFRLTNTMLCADSVNYLHTISPSWVTSLGRFILPVVEKIRGTYELTWLIGLISITLIGFSGAVVAMILKIKGKISLFMLSWLMVASPVVTSTFAYMYTADGYMLGLFFSVLAVFLCVKIKGWKGILAGGITLFLSLGFYQAFITTTMIVIVMYLIKQLLHPEIPMKEIWKNIGRFVAMGVTGLVIYLVAVKLVWHFGGYGTTSYMGMDSEAGFSIAVIGQAVVDCCIDFARFFLVRWKITLYNVTNVMLFVLIAVMFVYVVTKKKMWKTGGRIALILFFIVCIPFLTHIFEFASGGVSYTSTTMSYSLTMIFAFPLLLESCVETGKGEWEEWKDKEYCNRNWLWIVGVLLLLVIAGNFTVIANKAYYNMETANTKVEMLINRLVTRMEMQEGYSSDMEVAIIGSCYQTPEYVDSAPMMSGVVSNIFISQGGEYVNLMNWYLSTGHSCASTERLKELVRMPEFETMTKWPSENSVRIIDGTIVLYLSDVGLGSLYEE